MLGNDWTGLGDSLIAVRRSQISTEGIDGKWTVLAMRA